MSTPDKAVVVGVGADGSHAAIDHAVAEARRQALPLHLVHVLQRPVGEAYAELYVDMTATGKATLAAAREHAAERAGSDVPVTAEVVVAGWVVDQLARSAEGATMLVLQHRALGRVQRIMDGSVVKSVAGRTPVPVISVPEGRDPTADVHGMLTAAVQDPAEAGDLLRIAFEEAHQRGAALVVLHAWWLNSGYDVGVVDEAYRAEVAASVRGELEPVLAPLRRDYPDVEVAVSVEHVPPAEAVLDAAESSDLLVLGRRHHLLPLGSHLGHVARSALAHSTCPVLLIPEPARSTADR
jgi:nucleotide-binding universal stress UspA family protein